MCPDSSANVPIRALNLNACPGINLHFTMTKDKNTLNDPRKLYFDGKFKRQKQDPPGLQCRMTPIPDCGEKSYEGHGRLRGRHALITGGDSGIGRAVAIAFAREGAAVAINYLPQEQEDADSLAEVLKADGLDLVQLPGDLRNLDFCRQVVCDAHSKLGGLDLLVLNAGVQTAQQNIADLTPEQVRRTFEVNVYAPIFLSQAAVPLMPSGSSVLITSSAEYFSPDGNLLDYASTKSADAAFGLALSKQLLEKGIRVNMVCPGRTWTPLQVTGGQPQDAIPCFGLGAAYGRAAQPAELAGVYVFLASDEASYVTGEIYGVTGGSSSR